MTIEVNKVVANSTTNQTTNNNKASFRGVTKTIPNDTLEISSKKKGMSNTANLAIGLGAIGAIISGIFIYKHFSKNKIKEVFNSVEQIDKRFAELEQNLSEVQQKFKEAFLRNDLTEEQTKEILNGYKEVEKLGLKSTKEEYVKAVFEQAKKNYQIYNPKMTIEINSTRMHEGAYGGCPMDNEAIFITKKAIEESNEKLFATIHHELRHAKQNECLYNAKPDKFKVALYDGIVFEHLNNDIFKLRSFNGELDKNVGSHDFSKKEVQDYIDKNLVNISKIIEENFDKPNINAIPENYKEIVDRIWMFHSSTLHYPERPEEKDAFKIGNMMRELIFGIKGK